MQVSTALLGNYTYHALTGNAVKRVVKGHPEHKDWAIYTSEVNGDQYVYAKVPFDTEKGVRFHHRYFNITKMGPIVARREARAFRDAMKRTKEVQEYIASRYAAPDNTGHRARRRHRRMEDKTVPGILGLHLSYYLHNNGKVYFYICASIPHGKTGEETRHLFSLQEMGLSRALRSAINTRCNLLGIKENNRPTAYRISKSLEHVDNLISQVESLLVI